MICLGNICRSPLAEGVLNKLIEERNLTHMIEVDSAATAGHTIGHPPDKRSLQVARTNSIELHREARQIRRTDFQRFDVILVMDHSNLEDVMKLTKNEFERGKVRLITDFDERPNKLKIVPDPYWGTISDFTQTHDQLVHCCEGWLNYIQSC